MSVLGKKWNIKSEDQGLDLIEKLLKNRGISSKEEKDIFFDGSFEQLLDPMSLKDMDKAIKRIQSAVENGEKIMIFGDYDVDGITGTAIVYDFLKKQGADVSYTLPDREKDGYGLKDYFIDKFHEEDVKLIITVDSGTSNLEEIKRAKKYGIDTVVTDHHTMPAELPPAVAIVNPHQTDCPYENKEICGSGIAFKLISALAPLYMDKEAADTYIKSQIGIAALGTVGDCMSLLNQENRVMVKEGLNSLMQGSHPGISKLLDDSGAKKDDITSITLGFHIGPRINAAGRLDVPDHSLELLLGNLEKVEILNKLNEQRKGLLEEYMKGVHRYMESRPLPHIVVIVSKAWRSGLLGLIASRVAETYGRPAIVMQDKGDTLVASMRSVNNFDITGLLRENMRDLFTAFGGHVMAGGFTLPKDNLLDFLEKVKAAGEKAIDPEDFKATLHLDCEINPSEVSMETVESLKPLGPFGQDNPEPAVVIKNTKILDIRPVGKTGEHLQFPVLAGDETFKAIAFRFGQHLGKIDPTLSYDIACTLEINEWNGNKNVQLKVLDLKPSEN